MGVSALQVMRRASLTQEIAQAMRASFNDVPAHEVARRVSVGELALLCAERKEGAVYAIVSDDGETVCIEAVQGTGGTELTRAIVAAASGAGRRCTAWVFNAARARLAARAGMILTGARRVGDNGIEQLQVST